MMFIQDLVIHAACKWPDNLAISAKGTNNSSLTYRELDQHANTLTAALSRLGVRAGDRVGIWLEKSASAIIAMQGILRIHAVYVPLDPLNPLARIQTIVQDCQMQALITTSQRASIFHLAEGEQNKLITLSIDDENFAPADNDVSQATDQPPDDISENSLAYILYTSGSTGLPKGICISHRNALAFITWAVQELQANSTDRFANHAPFHFDLSVLDLYGAFAVGASVHIIPEHHSYLPGQLVQFLLTERPTIWYSVPSVLMLMIDQGALLKLNDLPLKAILFAGETFPIKHLRRLHECWPIIRLLNLYGPTETNVCTFYEVKQLEKSRQKPVPIGKACSGDHVWMRKEDGTVGQTGDEGELMVEGPTVMLGYWSKQKQGAQPYATGDLVRLESDGNYVYLGRRDHMVKIRGYRVEPGDIEAALQEHPAIYEAAVIVVGQGIEARLVAFLVCTNTISPSLLEIKRHCAERLPRYMIVDTIRFVSSLHRTRNGKVDRITLLEQEQALHREREENMQRTVMIEQLRTYIAEHILDGKDIGLDESTPLLEWGIINSIEIVRLLSFIQQQFSVDIPARAIIADHFINVTTIADLVIKTSNEHLSLS